MNTLNRLSSLLLVLLLSACGSDSDSDTDGDTILDGRDNCPKTANLDQLNTDAEFTNGDALGDVCDNDDDADGVLDADDAFPLEPSESLDTDNDGLGNNEDPNDDNDAKLDVNDPFPLDATEWEDIDNDLIGDIKDLDVGNDNTASAQLARFEATDRATLFIGSDTEPGTEGVASVLLENAGDVNGDGTADLLVGVGEEGVRSGTVYLFFGGQEPWPEKIDLINIDDSIQYITFKGSVAENFTNLLGADITALGDVNGDGLDDFLMGGIGYKLESSFNFSGEAYLIFGRETWLADAGEDKTITMAELKSQYAITYQGQTNAVDLGERVAAAGDVNGDGYNDFMISEYGYSAIADPYEYTGRVSLIFGGEHLQPPETDTAGIRNIDTLSTSERTEILIDRVESDPDRTIIRQTIIGDEILGLGNFDNDENNYDDIAVTSLVRNQTFVLFGQETWPAVINLPTIENGKGFVFEAPASQPEIGIGKYLTAGDLNGDSIPELIIAQTSSTDASIPNKQGDVVILKGGVGNWPAALSLDNLTDFFGAVWSTSEKLALGSGLAVLPDNNNDGFGELLINAPKPESPGEGLIFKVAGDANLPAKELNSTSTDAGVEIIRNLSTEIAGTNIRTLGDHNGDGINEFVIDIQDASTEGRTENGLFYVIQGYSSLYPE